MRAVRAVVVDDSNLTSSNVAESEPVYAGGTTYALGARVRGTGGLAHTVFESLQAGNTGNALGVVGSLWWIKVGATNKFAMFDQKIGNQTTNADSIDVSFTVAGFLDAIAVLNASASTVRAIVTSPSAGVVYDKTVSMVAGSGVDDWLKWLIEPISRVDRVTFEDIPPFAGCTVRVILADPGATAACGELLCGASKSLGDTQWNPQIAFNDTSVKTRNDFGDVDLIPRPYYDSGTFTLNIDAGEVDDVKAFIASIRGQFVLFIGDPGYASTAIFGFVSGFTIAISYPTFSVASLSIEGAT